MRQILFLAFSLLLFTRCEKEIDLDLEDKSGSIVIEGNITDQPGPHYVSITKSVGFTEQNEYPPIADAIVTLSDDNGQSETLIYEANGRYKTTNFISSPGRTYTLTIIAEGAEYTAQSTMPQRVELEGLTQDSFSMGTETSYSILPVYTDPSVLGNHYLFVYSVNSSSELNFQTISDNINNGMVNQRSLMLPREDDDEDKVKPGDTIHVEMRCIDQSIYTYYTALIQISSNGGPGGGVTPANPPSNINNGALGYFSAHTSSALTIRIQ